MTVSKQICKFTQYTIL